MSHNDVVRDEFMRQAESFARAPALGAAEVTESIGEALGPLSGGRVLDVACGPGILTDVLRRVGGRPVGLDLTDGTLRLAQARAGKQGKEAVFVRGLAENLPFGANAFAAAVIRLALHHVERPVDVLSNVRAVMQPGARVVVLDILTSEDRETAALHNAIERLRDPSHTAFWSAPALEAALIRAGFEGTRAHCWDMPRRFSEWAEIINERKRMGALEQILRALARAGTTAGIALREEPEPDAVAAPGSDPLWFTYRWGLFVATAP